MAHIEKRGQRRYRARFRAPDGREQSRTFTTRVDAETWLASQTHAVSVGGYVDPVHGRQLFGNYANAWLAVQVFRDSTRERVAMNLRVHMLPTFATRRIASIRPSEIQAWVRAMTETHSPTTVKIVYRQLASIFRAAVNDGVLASSPCRGVKLPRVTRAQVEPMASEDVRALIDHAPDHLRTLVLTAAGSGMRQGEVLGLTVGQIDFLRRTIRVDRQLVTLQGQAPKFRHRRRKHQCGRFQCRNS